MAVENDEARYAFIADEFDRLSADLAAAESVLTSNSEPAFTERSPEASVDAALELLERIHQVVGDSDARADLPALFKNLGLQIGLGFTDAIKGKKRIVRRLAGGVIGFGGVELPVLLHGARRVDYAFADNAVDGQHVGLSEAQRGQESPPERDDSQPEGPPGPLSSHQEGISSTKVSRGDRTPLELFCREVVSWPAKIAGLCATP